jgi:hypothetical protein
VLRRWWCPQDHGQALMRIAGVDPFPSGSTLVSSGKETLVACRMHHDPPLRPRELGLRPHELGLRPRELGLQSAIDRGAELLLRDCRRDGNSPRPSVTHLRAIFRDPISSSDLRHLQVRSGYLNRGFRRCIAAIDPFPSCPTLVASGKQALLQ